MPSPGEHKTVQARILKYAQAIDWTYVSRAEAERRRGFDPDGPTPKERAPTEWQNVYEVTEEFYTHNGKYGTREEVVFLITGTPVDKTAYGKGTFKIFGCEDDRGYARKVAGNL